MDESKRDQKNRIGNDFGRKSRDVHQERITWQFEIGGALGDSGGNGIRWSSWIEKAGG